MRLPMHARRPINETLALSLFAVTLAFAVGRAAEARELLPKVSPVPATVTGTLEPLAVSVDGRSVIERSSPAEGLRVGGVEIRAADEPKRPYFAQVDARGALELVVTAGGRVESPVVVAIPLVEEARWGAEGAEVVIRTSGAVSEVWLDGKPVGFSGSEARFAPDQTEPDWWRRERTLELRGVEGKPGGFFTLSFEKEPEARGHRIGLGPVTPAAESGAAFLLQYSRLFPSRWTWSVGVRVTRHQEQLTHPSLPDGYIFEITGYAPEAQVGYRLFPETPGRLFDLRRLEAGATVSYAWIKRTYTSNSTSGFFSGSFTETTRHLHGGVYLWAEPLRWKSLGLGMGVDKMTGDRGGGGGGPRLRMLATYSF